MCKLNFFTWRDLIWTFSDLEPKIVPKALIDLISCQIALYYLNKYEYKPFSHVHVDVDDVIAPRPNMTRQKKIQKMRKTLFFLCHREHRHLRLLVFSQLVDLWSTEPQNRAFPIDLGVKRILCTKVRRGWDLHRGRRGKQFSYSCFPQKEVYLSWLNPGVGSDVPSLFTLCLAKLGLSTADGDW